MSHSDTAPGDSTIVAIATPPGRGGVGVVRLSGRDAFRIAADLFPGGAFQPRTAHYRILNEAGDRRIDDALITTFPAPGSYTGEDVVEIATHGSPVVQDWLLRACVRHGATPAQPGEFTERAFLNRRLDLTAAEAVRDLIEARTLGQAQLAAQQVGGAIAHAISSVKQALLELIAALEAGIDFAEDDLDTLPPQAVTQRTQSLLPPLAALLDSFAHGRLLREGLRLAIVGEPNVGKSSLFNRLVERERAIVTATPGTTRDVISEQIAIDGVPVELLDTAGLRDTDDEVERMGVARSRVAMADADVVLLVVDATRPQSGLHAVSALAGRPVIVVYNKADLQPSQNGNPDELTGARQLATAADTHPDDAGPAEAWPVVHTSALTGQGLPQLRRAILASVAGGQNAQGGATLTNLRQQQAISRAHAAILRAGRAAAASTPHEMVLLDLYEALHALDELTGETTPDDVLHLIFSTFCIGK